MLNFMWLRSWSMPTPKPMTNTYPLRSTDFFNLTSNKCLLCVLICRFYLQPQDLKALCFLSTTFQWVSKSSAFYKARLFSFGGQRQDDDQCLSVNPMRPIGPLIKKFTCSRIILTCQSICSRQFSTKNLKFYFL